MFFDFLMKFLPRWITASDSAIIVRAVAGKSLQYDCRASGHPTSVVGITKNKLL